MTRNRNTKSCTICNKRVVITNSTQRERWIGYCRSCKYMIDLFSFNGNLLQNY